MQKTKGRDRLVPLITLASWELSRKILQGHRRSILGSPTPTEPHFLKFPPASISMQYFGYQVFNHTWFLEDSSRIQTDAESMYRDCPGGECRNANGKGSIEC